MRKNFSYRIERFLRAVIRHRRLLISKNKSPVNKLRALNLIAHIERHLQSGFSNKGFARFFLKNKDEIRYLIKDEDIKKLNDFNRFIHLSQSYQYL
ncbi:MAG: hypothetical protein ISS18_15880 [Bacteroidales bacterium]|nr:hypothetical protein [Bacteroidales bacterium]